MKKYIKPVLEIEDIILSDIILESGNGEINGGKPSDDNIVFPNVFKPGL